MLTLLKKRIEAYKASLAWVPISFTPPQSDISLWDRLNAVTLVLYIDIDRADVTWQAASSLCE